MARGLQTTKVLLGLLVPFVVYVFYVVVRFVVWVWRNYRVISQFPSPSYHWLYGNMHLTEGYLGDKFLSVTTETVKKHPRAYTLWVSGWIGEICVTHPVTIKQLMKTSTSKSQAYETLRPWLGNGLLISNREVWKVHRRLLTPALHFSVLKQYMNVYNTEASRIIERLSNHAVTGESFEMFQQASMTAMEIILQCAFSGGKMSAQTKNEYVAAVRKLGDLYMKRMTTSNPLYRMSDFIYNLSSGGREFKRHCDFVHGIAENIIKQRRQELESSEGSEAQKKKPDFIDILLRARDEDGRGLSDLEIREEVDTFLFGGHDTTASTLCWTLYSLAQHPEYQDKVREEVQQILSDRSADMIEWEDLSKLSYLTRCLKEAMRLHTPVPFFSRTIKEDTVIDGIRVPKDSFIGVSIYDLNHNPAVWGPDHMEFDPDRFHPDRMTDMDSHAFIPFSAGQRNCIGQNFAMNEVKVLLARLLHKFEFELEPSRSVEKEVLLVMTSRNGMWLKVRPVHSLNVIATILFPTAQHSVQHELEDPPVRGQIPSTDFT